MQVLTAPPRDQLTADQVTALLIGAAGVDYGRGLEVLDASLNVLADASDNFEGGQVTRTMQATVHGSSSLIVSTDLALDQGTQLLRPYMTISDGVNTARFNCGVYRAWRPSSDYSTTPGTYTFTGADRLSLLNRPVGDAYHVARGTQYLAAVRQAITDAGLDVTTVRLDMTKASSILPADKTWPLLVDTSKTTTDTPPRDATGDSGQSGTTWLQIINDLLGAINYRGLWADQDGVFTSVPYQRPAVRPAEFTFDYDDPNLTVIRSDRSVQVDQSDPTNVWIFQQSNLTDSLGNPIEPTEGAGQYTRVNQNYGPTSLDQQGGIRWTQIVQLDAADQATLVALGDKQVDDAIAQATTFTVKSAPFPVAGHWDLYSYSDTTVLGGAVNVISTSWTLDLGSSSTTAADQQHTWASVTP